MAWENGIRATAKSLLIKAQKMDGNKENKGGVTCWALIASFARNSLGVGEPCLCWIWAVISRRAGITLLQGFCTRLDPGSASWTQESVPSARAPVPRGTGIILKAGQACGEEKGVRRGKRARWPGGIWGKALRWL